MALFARLGRCGLAGADVSLGVGLGASMPGTTPSSLCFLLAVPGLSLFVGEKEAANKNEIEKCERGRVEEKEEDRGMERPRRVRAKHNGHLGNVYCQLDTP